MIPVDLKLPEHCNGDSAATPVASNFGFHLCGIGPYVRKTDIDNGGRPVLVIDAYCRDVMVKVEQRSRVHTFAQLGGMGARSGIKNVSKTWGPWMEFTLAVIGHPAWWFLAAGARAAKLTGLQPNFVGAAAQIGKGLAQWAWAVNSLIRAVDPDWRFATTNGSLSGGTYGVRSAALDQGSLIIFRAPPVPLTGLSVSCRSCLPLGGGSTPTLREGPAVRLPVGTPLV